MKNLYEIVRGYGNCAPDWDDGYIAAFEEAETELYNEYEDVIHWLGENLEGRYKIIDDYDHEGTLEVTCILSLKFEDEESELAFKLTWQ